MQRKTLYIGIPTLILCILLTTPVLAAGTTMSSQIFAPLAYLNLAQTYDHYAAIIDLFIYALILIGVAQVTLGPRFAGRGGKAICTGVGISLAIAMTITETRYGFSLKSFGPIAAGIIILLFGIMIYRLLQHTGVSRTGGLAISYAFMFLAVHGAAPRFVAWLQGQLPFLYLLALVGLIASFYFAFTTLRPEAFRQHRFEERLREARENEPGHKHQRETIEKENGFIQKFLKPATKNSFRESLQIENDLQAVADAIQKHGQNPEARSIILQRMGEIVPKGQELLKTIRELREFTKRLLRADTELFSEKNQERLAQMTPQDRELWSKELHDEAERLDLEKKTSRLQDEIEGLILRVGERLKKAAEHLKNAQIHEAWQEAQEAMKIEKDVTSIARNLKRLEKTIHSLARRDFRNEKKFISA